MVKYDIPPVALVIGASSAIGQALIESLLKEPSQKIFAVSQRKDIDQPLNSCGRLSFFTCDYSESQVERVVLELQQSEHPISQVFICNGVLHGEFGGPEKSLKEYEPQNTEAVFKANILVPLTWLAQLEKLPLRTETDIVLLSARIGSIGDNKLGGWYSYRASKAALNMLTKTAAIELKRKFKQWSFVLYHPGTTDTPLSKPFQKNVPPDKLFTPEFTANQLLSLMPTLSRKQTIHYVDWQGLQIDW